MGYGGFEMGFFWYAGYEVLKVGGKSGMRDFVIEFFSMGDLKVWKCYGVWRI